MRPLHAEGDIPTIQRQNDEIDAAFAAGVTSQAQVDALFARYKSADHSVRWYLGTLARHAGFTSPLRVRPASGNVSVWDPVTKTVIHKVIPKPSEP
jgi:hypothetical protein